MSNSILVVGGAGYIGSHACKTLAANGYLPVVFDDLSAGHDWAVKWGPLEIGDILDRERLKQVFRAHRPRAVMHFGGKILVGESMAKPAEYRRVNVEGCRNLLDVMGEEAVETLVYSSSCAVYGNPQRPVLDEEHPLSPVNPYGASKLEAEQHIREAGAHGIRAVILRYFNAAGADPDGDIGEAHDPETHLIPRVLEAALGQLDELVVHGTDYDTPDGTAIRDYVHVQDIAECHQTAFEALVGGADTDCYNIGTGAGSSVKEVIEAAERTTGLTVPVRYGDRRQGDVSVLVASNGKVREVLGWSPHCSDLDTIVKTAFDWAESQIDGSDAAVGE